LAGSSFRTGAALGSYFRFLSVADPNSIFTAGHELLPGHCLRVTSAGVEERQYWRPAIQTDPNMPFDAACRGFYPSGQNRGQIGVVKVSCRSMHSSNLKGQEC
jgi:hypothetical protein